MSNSRHLLMMRPMLVTAVTIALALHSCVGFTKAPANYHIQTDEGNERFFKFQTLNGQFRKEKRLEDGTQVGTYGWVDPTGLLGLYDYVADDWGYRIVNSYTENLSHGTAPYSAPGAYAPSTGYSQNSVEMDVKALKTHGTSPGKEMYAEKASNVYAPPPPTIYGPPSSKEQSGHHEDPKDSYSVPKKPETSNAVPEKVPTPPVKYSAPPAKEHHHHPEPKNTYGVPAKAPESTYSVPALQKAHVEAPKTNYGPPKETYIPPVAKNTYSPPKASYVPPVVKDTYAPPKVSYSAPPKDTYVAPKLQAHTPPPPPKVTYAVPVKATYVPPKKDTYVPPKQTYAAPSPPVSYSAPVHKEDDDHHHSHVPAASYSVPAVKAHKPVVTYEPPKASYVPPVKSTYKAPTQSYKAPVLTSYAAPKKTYVTVKKRPYDPKPAYSKNTVAAVYKAPADTYKPVTSYSAPKSYHVRTHYSAPAKVTSYKPVTYSKAASHHSKSYSKAHTHHHHDDHHYSASHYTPASYKVVSIVKPGSGYGESSRKVIGYEDPQAAAYHNKAHVNHKATSYKAPSSHHQYQPPTYSHHQKHTVSYSAPAPKVESYSHVSHGKGHDDHHHDDHHDDKNTYVPPQQDTKAHGHHHKEKAGFFAPPKAHHSDHHTHDKGHVEHHHDDHDHEVKNTYVPPDQDAKAHHHHHKEKAGFFAPPKVNHDDHHHHHQKAKAGFFAPPTAKASHHQKGGFFSPAARPYKAASPTTQAPHNNYHHQPSTPAHYSRGVLTPVKAAENKGHHQHQHHKEEHKPLEIPVTSYRPTQRPSSPAFNQAHPEIRFHAGNGHGSTTSFNPTPQPPQSGVFFAQVLPQQETQPAHQDTQGRHSSGEVSSVLTPPATNAQTDHFERFLGHVADNAHDPELDKVITKFTPHRFETADRNLQAHFVAEDHEHAARSRAFIPPAAHLGPAAFSHRRKKRDVRLHKNFHTAEKVPNRETTVFVPPKATEDIHHAHTFSSVPKNLQLAYAPPTAPPAVSSHHSHQQQAHHHQHQSQVHKPVQSSYAPPTSPLGSHNTHHHQEHNSQQSQLQKPYHPAAASFRAHKEHYLAQNNNNAHSKIKDPNVLLGVYDHGADANFRYNTGNQFHYEKTLSNGQRQGKYGYVDPFGIFRAIHYQTSPYDGGLHVKKDFRYVGQHYDTSYE